MTDRSATLPPLNEARFRDLMEKAAEALEDGRNPLDRSFLVEHRVTANECFDLADGIAAGIRLALVMITPKEKR